MKCDDARQCFPAFVGGPVALTDWALVEAHVRQCDECRTLLAQQKLSAVKPPRTQELVGRLRASLEGPVRAAVPAVAGGIEVTRGGVTRVVDQLAGDVTRGIEAARRGARRLPSLLAEAHDLALLPFQRAGHALARGVEATWGGVAGLAVGLTAAAARVGGLARLLVQGTESGVAQGITAVESAARRAATGLARTGGSAIEATRVGVATVVSLARLAFRRSEDGVARGAAGVDLAARRTAGALTRAEGWAMGATRVGAARVASLAGPLFRGLEGCVARTTAASETAAERVAATLTSSVSRASDAIRIGAARVMARTSRMLSAFAAMARDAVPARSRLVGVGAGVASLIVLTAMMLLLWPPEWPGFRPSSDGGLRSSSARPTTASTPEPTIAERPSITRLPAATRTPAPQPEARRAVAPPAPIEAQAQVPPPSRSRAQASASAAAIPSWSPAQSEGAVRSQDRAQDTDSSDPSGVIDWLLKDQRGGRKQVEGP